MVIVPLDGMAEAHDASRHLHSGAPTFDRIMGNLRSIHTSMFVNVRNNLHAGSLDSFDELCEAVDAIARELTINQMFMLAILPVVPTRGNPIQHPEVFERFRNKRIVRFMDPKDPILTQEESSEILSHNSDCLDPDLRKPDEYTNNYPQYITLTNERFGPFQNEDYHNPMETSRG